MNEDAVTVTFTEAEAELVMLALDYYRRYHMDEYNEEDKKAELAILRSAYAKLR